jgi:hypothetical protein
MAMTPAERARRARRRKRVANGTQDLILVGRGNGNARKHGGHAGDVDGEAQSRLPGMPDYLSRPVFAEAVAIAKRRVVMAERIGLWVAALSEGEATTPAKAGSSSPAEISRQHDLAALNALGALGLTPQASARWGRGLEESGRPDIALQWQAWQEGEGSDGA